MKLLLDTQCWLWMNASPDRLSTETLALLRDPKSERLLSAASVWEIAIKFELGKLPLPAPPRDYVPSRLALTVTSTLVITGAHALRAAELPPHHRDPFDRMLIAQAMVEGLRIITADRQFSKYGVDVIPA